jgi:UDP-N-acetylmuramoyl-L-alanyl-D-glutamate--2,6-diaminopimelate ligase
MNLSQLFSEIEGPSKASPSSLVSAIPATEVLGITSSSKQVMPGWVFVAICGGKIDGHDFISDALSKGAVAVVGENAGKLAEYSDVPTYVVKSARDTLDKLAAKFYQFPSRKLFCIGVTGTNGKTSTTYLVEWILNSVGVATGVIGTINHHLKEKIWSSEMTTPEPVAMQSRLREMNDEGARAVALEVSSHALDQFRVDGINFNTVVFTNLTRDHLDYHKTMQNYFETKQRLFTSLLWKTSKFPSTAIVNTDDPWGRRLRVASFSTLWTYGQSHSDFQYRILEHSFAGLTFELKTPFSKFEVRLPMCGLHNAANAVAAIAVAVSAGVPVTKSLQALEDFPGVPGRMQRVSNNRSLHVFVDYAHTPDALRNVLQSLREIKLQLKSQNSIWVIFGCGGDRDTGKRPQMAQIACELADRVMVTSDNPRTEFPEKIVQDILQGVPSEKKSKVISQIDRRNSFVEVFAQAQPGDVVLIAGKGHEEYQILGTEKSHFSDYETAQELLR